MKRFSIFEIIFLILHYLLLIATVIVAFIGSFIFLDKLCNYAIFYVEDGTEQSIAFIILIIMLFNLVIFYENYKK